MRAVAACGCEAEVARWDMNELDGDQEDSESQAVGHGGGGKLGALKRSSPANCYGAKCMVIAKRSARSG